MNGGLSVFTAVMGKPNTYKTKLARYMMLSAASKAASSGFLPYLNTYDTEVNVDVEHCLNLSRKFEQFKDIDLCKEGAWSITDKTHHLGNEWFKLLKDFLRNEKIKNAKSYTLETPFLDKDNKPIFTIFPSFGDLDSVSEFSTADIEDIQNKNELGDSGGNTIHMRNGLAKTRLLMEIPSICNAASHYIIMTAHIGKDMAIGASPMSMPVKQLPHMRPGEVVKGVAGKFLFLSNLLWQTTSSTTFNNQTTKGPEYPKTRERVDEGSMDLNSVNVKLVRNKSGASGYSFNIIISQTEGVLPSLTEFNYVKENERYGIEGSRDTYNMILYPDVKVGRTTVRNLLDTDPMLRRAVKITADLLQIKTYYKELPFDVPEVKDLYEKLGKTYDWKVLLNTRDYWTFNQYEHPVPFLSTMDLIEMYYDKYVPFWLTKKK
ncbi:MAG: hypothetical protein HGA25_01775 [Clostridiales bacterium]|nr:hypothetical protein [Clostridiales bacterium]